jgi:membrane protease YdiL (CAAX protease family)
MVQIIGLLAISWLLIWLFEKGNLSVLGLRPTASKLKISAILFIVTAICCSTAFFMRMYFTKEQFSVNPQLNTSLAGNGIWVNFKSVLFEELLCRGVGLYILIKWLGAKWAILISAVIFGILHWLNAGVWGNGEQMAIVFAYTFTFGLLLAYAYARSLSLYLPFAIHFGWNLTQNFIFPENLNGNTFFVMVLQPVVTISYFVYFTMILFPKISAILIDYLLIKRSKSIIQTNPEHFRVK